jgi:hypothetical protein
MLINCTESFKSFQILVTSRISSRISWKVLPTGLKCATRVFPVSDRPFFPPVGPRAAPCIAVWRENTDIESQSKFWEKFIETFFILCLLIDSIGEILVYFSFSSEQAHFYFSSYTLLVIPCKLI